VQRQIFAATKCTQIHIKIDRKTDNTGCLAELQPRFFCLCVADEQHLQIQFELGHVAILRPHVTSDGHTHDWEVYVRPSEGATGVFDGLHFIERVEFHLHETYDRRTVGMCSLCSVVF